MRRMGKWTDEDEGTEVEQAFGKYKWLKVYGEVPDLLQIPVVFAKLSS